MKTVDTGLNCINTMQAARQAAEQRSAELAVQVDKFTEQAVESAADAQRMLDAAIQKAATDSETTQVRPFQTHHLRNPSAFAILDSGDDVLSECCQATNNRLHGSHPKSSHFHNSLTTNAKARQNSLHFAQDVHLCHSEKCSHVSIN
jgi:hypothetical protein